MMGSNNGELPVIWTCNAHLARQAVRDLVVVYCPLDEW